MLENSKNIFKFMLFCLLYKNVENMNFKQSLLTINIVLGKNMNKSLTKLYYSVYTNTGELQGFMNGKVGEIYDLFKSSR